jgi:hypothetical protein
MAGGHQVVERAQPGVECDILERARQTKPGDPVSRGFRQVGSTLEEDGSFFRPVDAAVAVEFCGFS